MRRADKAAADAIIAKGGKALFVHTDVTDEDSVKSAVAQAVARFGALHILYNNAGGSTFHDGPLTEAPIDEFWRAIKLDLLGTWLCSRHAIPEIVKAGGGSVINASSVVALIGWPGKDAYTASKGAISALTRSMATEFAARRYASTRSRRASPRRRACSSNSPSRTTTKKLAERHLVGLAEPEDVANAALFLASDESARTTGHILAVDSGLTIT